MRWLLAPTVRPFVATAALASLLLNLALLAPALYMLQVYDRVFASRSVETLVMLSALAVGALALAVAMDRARAVALEAAGRAVDAALLPPTLHAALRQAAQACAEAERPAVQDVARLRAFLASPAVQALFDAPWMPLYLAVIAALHPALGALATACAALLFGLGLVTERVLRGDAAAAAGASRGAARQVDTLLRHAEVLLGGGLLAHALAAWCAGHDAALAAQSRAARSHALLAALGRGLRQGVQVAMLGLGAWLVVADGASPGIMLAATVLVARALQPVDHLIAGWKSLLEVRAAWARLRGAAAGTPQAEALRLPPARGELRLERASLVAPGGLPLLKSISLVLPAGQCLGIVGPSGAGKTSLLRLMLGLRAPHAGAVRLDGVALAAWPEDQLAQALGYLPQDVALFPGSVAQNIARLGPVDAGRVVEAARLAGVHELVARLPRAYDTELGEDGAPLSGGQRQRIGLARALYGRPPLVVLDEPDAGLDAEGEQALVAALAALKAAGSSVVLVSHRRALMRHADQLAVLRDGALEICGPRAEVEARLSGQTVRPLRAADGGPTPTLQGVRA